ncbi:MAG TPA: DUF4864 domain-containing protein [Rhodothermales bacterium]|nr:DUF4864 domain-containing protein [Rhodothermales bacterium]
MRTLSTAGAVMLTACMMALAPGPASHIDKTKPDQTGRADSTRVSLASRSGSLLGMRPSPALSPADVVQIVVNALGSNDEPYADAGIEVAFRFSSPDNRQSTGPLEKFVELVHNPVYSPVLNHQHARYGHINVNDDRASISVVIVSEDAERYGYLFTLSRQQDGPYDGCWMTESVVPFEIESDDAPLLVLQT